MQSHEPHPGHENHYLRLGLMSALSFIAMYILMYSMVDRFSYAYPNLNQLYMAATMTAPMVFLEMLFMRGMYTNASLNAAIMVGSIVALAIFFAFIRMQSGIGDTQFLRSMIPHHSGAILMCRKASIRDSEIQSLCRDIIDSQQKEIDQMEAISARLKKH